MRVEIVCILLSLAALACSQRPEPCYGPITWTGNFLEESPNRKFGEIYYDTLMQRIAFVVETPEQRIWEINLMKEKKRYTVDMDTQECTVSDLSDSFRPIQIPPDASYLGEFYLGSSGIFDGSVLIQQWVGNIADPPGQYSIQVTVNGCVPVTEFSFDEETKRISVRSFFNIIIGISDPGVFVPPEECVQKELRCSKPQI